MDDERVVRRAALDGEDPADRRDVLRVGREPVDRLRRQPDEARRVRSTSTARPTSCVTSAERSAASGVVGTGRGTGRVIAVDCPADAGGAPGAARDGDRGGTSAARRQRSAVALRRRRAPSLRRRRRRSRPVPARSPSRRRSRACRRRCSGRSSGVRSPSGEGAVNTSRTWGMRATREATVAARRRRRRPPAPQASATAADQAATVASTWAGRVVVRCTTRTAMVAAPASPGTFAATCGGSASRSP